MTIRPGSASSYLTAACLTLLPPSLATADPIPGQVDTFEDGTTQGWRINLLGLGSPPAAALPTNVPTGGPGGTDDNYLQLTALGVPDAGGRLVAMNFDPRWTGDYLAAGVDSLVMDVNNLGATDLALRLLLERTEGGPPTDIALTADAVTVASGGGWTRVTFRIGSADLLALTGTVDAVLGSVSLIRLVHSPEPEFPGPPVSALLGVDNITAVPEPGSIGLLAAGLAGLGLRARRRRAA